MKHRDSHRTSGGSRNGTDICGFPWLFSGGVPPASVVEPASREEPSPEVVDGEASESTAQASPLFRDTDVAIQTLMQPWTGDLDGMVERRVVRILVTFSKTNYFLDLNEHRGITYEAGKLFEEEVNKKLGSGVLRLNMAFIPVSRDELIPALVEGAG